MLLSLLVPAMDKAMYQANLAACGSNLKGIASSVSAYAVASRQSYPDRNQNVNTQKQPHNLALNANTADDRLALEGYVETDLLVDPLCEKVNLARGETHPNSAVFASYNLYFGYGYNGNGGMRKIGEKVTYTNNSASPPRTYRFTVIAADQDVILSTLAWAHSSHPDADGIMHNRYFQDQPDNDRSIGGVGILAPQMVLSWWESPRNHRRGPIEMNTAFADGSVTRYNGVEWDAGHPQEPSDERMVGVPEFSDGVNYPGWWITLPRP